MELDLLELEVPLTSVPSFTTSPALTEAKPSTDVWFKDGNIILEAEGSQFKVFMGVLAANSTVFNDMLAVGSNPANNEMVEGCPVVRVYDTALDMMHFLKALHHVGYYDPPKTKDFQMIAAILRLSTKYNVDFLRRRAMAQITPLYPTTLPEWDQRMAYTFAVEWFHARPFAAFLLAKETGHLALLPLCMYSCASTVDINDILDGLKSIDGKHIELEWVDKRACIRGRQNLMIALRSEAFAFLAGNLKIPNCSSLQRCDSAKLRRMQSIEAVLGKSGFSQAGFLFIKFDWPSFRNAVCENCYTASQTDYNQQRQRIWDKLPSYFDMPPWEELVKSSSQ